MQPDGADMEARAEELASEACELAAAEGEWRQWAEQLSRAAFNEATSETVHTAHTTERVWQGAIDRILLARHWVKLAGMAAIAASAGVRIVCLTVGHPIGRELIYKEDGTWGHANWVQELQRARRDQVELVVITHNGGDARSGHFTGTRPMR